MREGKSWCAFRRFFGARMVKEVVPSSRTNWLVSHPDSRMFPDVHPALFNGAELKITLRKERSLPDFP